MKSLTGELRQFITDNFLFGQWDEALTDEDSLMDNGIIDSTGVLELVTHIETTYGIKVQDEELVPENLDSIGNLAVYVEDKRGSAA